MKFAHVVRSDIAGPRLAVIRDDRAVFVDEISDGFKALQQLVQAGPQSLQQLRESVAQLSDDAGAALDELQYASAILDPPSVLAVGLNYDEHANELSLDNDSGPVLFALFPNSLNGHGQDVPLPVRLSEEIDYEGELGVIIGRNAKNVTPEEALDYVFGYTVVNDITARNIQFAEPQWSRCKSFDGFTPVGPVVVTADEIADPQALGIITEVNGLRVQDSTTAHMIRSVAQLISSISQSLTLLPGTLISTGSPGGAGRSRKPPLYLTPGTEVTVAIEGIGVLSNRCVTE